MSTSKRRERKKGSHKKKKRLPNVPLPARISHRLGEVEKPQRLERRERERERE